MKKLLLIALMATLGRSQASVADSITLSKAAELSCHRIERLVTLKKIDAGYETNFSTLTVVALQQTQPTDPAFKAVESQYLGADGTAAQIEILMDNQGKPLSFNVITGATAVNAPVWTGADSINLAENSLHFVLEGWQTTQPEVKPFYTDMKAMRLFQVTDSSGQVLSKAEFLSYLVGTTLTVYLKTDGTFVSAAVK